MIFVGYLEGGALPCNSHVNYVTLNISKSYCSNTKLYIFFIYTHADCLKSTQLNAANSQYAIKQHIHTILQLYTLLYFK